MQGDERSYLGKTERASDLPPPLSDDTSRLTGVQSPTDCSALLLGELICCLRASFTWYEKRGSSTSKRERSCSLACRTCSPTARLFPPTTLSLKADAVQSQERPYLYRELRSDLRDFRKSVDDPNWLPQHATTRNPAALAFLLPPRFNFAPRQWLLYSTRLGWRERLSSSLALQVSPSCCSAPLRRRPLADSSAVLPLFSSPKRPPIITVPLLLLPLLPHRRNRRRNRPSLRPRRRQLDPHRPSSSPAR